MIPVILLSVLLALARVEASLVDPWGHGPGHGLCSAYGFQVLEAKFGKETHLLCLKLKEIGSSPIASHRAALLIDPEAEETPDSIQAYPLANITMAYGFPVEDPASGSAEGYIGEDNQFYGVLHLANRTLHADPYGSDYPHRMFGAFEHEYIAAPVRPRRDQAQVNRGVAVAPSLWMKQLDSHVHKYHPCQTNIHASITQIKLPFGDSFPFRIEDRPRVPGVARARVCDLLLLADKEFYDQDANSSLNHVVRRMVHAVAQADIIFRNADFNEDGVPDNIGFSVKYILVLTSNETNNRVFGDLLQHKTIDGRQYLMRFARLRRLSEVCLGVAFSGHAFHNRTLGLSFTSLGGGMGGAAGGLCDRRAYGRSFNTLALAHATTEGKERVPERIAAMTLAHEIGHSFGAHHDDNFPNPECRGFLMGSQSSAVQNNRHFEFSLCSKRLIAATLNSMSYCLIEEDRPYCGNGIVEEGEACDCGMPSRCSQRDPCCTPRAGGALVFEEGTLHKEGCSVAPTAICHPSQGLCCTADCKYADLSKHGIDCETQEHECTCTDMTALCPCGLGGRCLLDGSCHAAECATLGLRECQCQKKGVGGTLGHRRLCGVCCQLEPKGEERGAECVGAEDAALAVLANGSRLPDDWPDGNYRGPNVTLRLCTEEPCVLAVVRAWSVGEVCVTRNVVGICSISGICKQTVVGPRSNVYPDEVHVRLMRHYKASSTRAEATVLNLLVVLIYVVK